MLVYLDRYISQLPESVLKIGDFSISHLLQFKPQSTSPDEECRFEAAVPQFMEDLPQMATRIRNTDDRLWSVLHRHILPEIETGEVRAAAPRYRN
jgi:hypothetical protein